MSAPGAERILREEADASLWQAFKTGGQAEARKKLFQHYANFARNIARRHYNRQTRGDIEMGDLCQLAYAGLLEALDRYDLARGVPFRAFAAHRISGSIRDGLSHMSEVREQISSHVQMRRERLQSLSDGVANQGGSAMDKLADIAVGLALGFMLEGTGLYVPEKESDEGTAAAANVYEGLAWRETVAHLQDELRALPEREQQILRYHYLDSANFENIANMLGLTKGRISQIHRSALLLLRKRMRGRGHFRLEK